MIECVRKAQRIRCGNPSHRCCSKYPMTIMPNGFKNELSLRRLPDGTYGFRKVNVLLSRQEISFKRGKTK